MADDLVVELLAEFDLALPQRPLVGLALVPPKLGTVGHRRTHEGFAVLILIDQLDCGAEQPLHLISEPCSIPAPAAVDSQGPHELRERTPQDELAASGPYRFGREPGQQQARQVAVGEFVVSTGNYD